MIASMNNTWRASLTLAAMFALGFVVIFGYACATRMQSDSGTTGDESAISVARADVEPAPRSASAPADTTQPSPPADTSSAEISPEDAVAKWVADATSDDTKARAAAIVALGTAPKSQAIPPLEKVLTSGTDEDRQSALTSLRKLALQQGDADGAVRQVLRQAIYHGDNETITLGAQAALDDVEREQK